MEDDPGAQVMWARFFSTSPSATPPKGFRWSGWIRQVHRWLAIVFTATVVANFIAMALGEPPAWIVYSPLLPLFLLMFSGLYMFVLPYLRRSQP
jgi:cellulose synthase/poly-beta-1,6-N-acetylglucosamine synthase-like glycosyltransferase